MQKMKKGGRVEATLAGSRSGSPAHGQVFKRSGLKVSRVVEVGENVCANCSVDISDSENEKYCSRGCLSEGISGGGNPNASGGREVVCDLPSCDKTDWKTPSQLERSEKHFCCDEHKKDFDRIGAKCEEDVVCEADGCSVSLTKKQIWAGNDFCSSDCAYGNRSIDGRSLVEVWCRWCASVFEVKESHYYCRQCCSKKCQSKLNGFGCFGSNNINWRGGSSFEPYPVAFNDELKERVRDRDNRCCRKCGVSESDLDRRLDIHHINGVKSNCLQTNLISLCRNCHASLIDGALVCG